VTVIGVVQSRDDIGGLGIALFGLLFTVVFLAIPRSRCAERPTPWNVASGPPPRSSRWSNSRPEVAGLSTRSNTGSPRAPWRVMHPPGSFEATFETDAAWTLDLHIGTKVLQLVDPDRQRAGVHVGPVEGGPPNR
jgi:hypothetical protein